MVTIFRIFKFMVSDLLLYMTAMSQILLFLILRAVRKLSISQTSIPLDKQYFTCVKYLRKVLFVQEKCQHFSMVFGNLKVLLLTKF
jgi:hypothetical protein